MSEANETAPVWRPDPATAERSNMARFMRRCAARYGLADDYAALYRWSLDEPADFWREFGAFAGVTFAVPPSTVFSPGATLADGRWFAGAQLNYAAALLGRPDDSIALVFRDERGRRSELTRRELDEQVRRVAAQLQAFGLQPGDRVVALLPNCPEAIIAMLACAALGVIFSSCSPDFGAATLLARFGQIAPRLLFACDGYSYAGKRIDCRERLATLAARLPSLQRLVLVPFLADAPDPPAIAGVDVCRFATLLAAEPLLQFPALPFDQPLFILYSSGTTGLPKCIVHGAGGTLLQHLKEHLLHTDLGPGSRLLYFTTCGWMMWNWLAGALATGATVVLYDGSPQHPDNRALWDVVAAERVTVFGTSPRFLTASEKTLGREGLPPLPELRTVLSTGAPLPPQSYDYVRAACGPEVQLCSISGGTDIISCFVLGNPLLPVYRGEIQGPGLGMAVDVFDAHGRPVRGQAGELVCRQPFPSMPLGFRNDPDGTQFQAAYFARFPGVWAHGDLAEWTAHGGMVIHGRADAVLNPGGVRIGSAEVCGPALALPGVADALAVGQRHAGDERIVLFVVTAPGYVLTPGLEAEVRAAIRAAASPRHVPAVIVAVPELPRTLSGKVVELAVRAVIHGEAVGNRGALANPAALDYFRDLPELA